MIIYWCLSEKEEGKGVGKGEGEAEGKRKGEERGSGEGEGKEDRGKDKWDTRVSRAGFIAGLAGSEWNGS